MRRVCPILQLQLGILQAEQPGWPVQAPREDFGWDGAAQRKASGGFERARRGDQVSSPDLSLLSSWPCVISAHVDASVP